VEQTSANQLAVEEARALRIESDAIRTRLAFAVFAMLDVRDESSGAMKQTANLLSPARDVRTIRLAPAAAEPIPA
jgi:hypothetical protein